MCRVAVTGRRGSKRKRKTRYDGNEKENMYFPTASKPEKHLPAHLSYPPAAVSDPPGRSSVQQVRQE